MQNPSVKPSHGVLVECQYFREMFLEILILLIVGKCKKQPVEEDPESVKFVLMLKKGNKQQFRDLNIPVTENLAANIRDKQVAERAEHEEMKRLVLDYNQRQEEEAFNGECMTSHTLI